VVRVRGVRAREIGAHYDGNENIYEVDVDDELPPDDEPPDEELPELDELLPELDDPDELPPEPPEPDEPDPDPLLAAGLLSDFFSEEEVVDEPEPESDDELEGRSELLLVERESLR
jgi:hypothetical protein